MIKTISEFNCMPPSVYAELFYAACETYGAKFVCPVCKHKEDWEGRKHETERCGRPDARCNGVMVLTINEGGEENVRTGK